MAQLKFDLSNCIAEITRREAQHNINASFLFEMNLYDSNAIAENMMDSIVCLDCTIDYCINEAYNMLIYVYETFGITFNSNDFTTIRMKIRELYELPN